MGIRKLTEKTQKELSQYNKELEQYFTLQSDKVDMALSLINVLNEASIDKFGYLNENISAFDIERVLKLVKKNLEPVSMELSELQANPSYLYCDNKNIIQIKR